MFISENIKYIGVNDHEVDLFEGQFVVPNGMAYNSYVIIDEKIAVLDTVDKRFEAEWLNNLSVCLGERQPDFLIVQHMEPDHSACICAFLEKYPSATLVGNKKTFALIDNFFSSELGKNRLEVSDGNTLSLGKRELTFVFAPMVHWPEVMFTYDSTDKTLFSADAFGKFGALDADEDWACEARRYYFGIVGKYGVQAQAALKKVSAYEVKTICPLHGPVLSENLGYYLNLYDIWSSYGVESEGVFIAYTSVYGHTELAVKELQKRLIERGCPKVTVSDLARSDMAENVEDAFRYGKIVLATTTYNGDVFPFMKTFVDALTERGYRNRTIGIIENGSWAPQCAKVIKKAFEQSKNIAFTETVVSIRSALKPANYEEIDRLSEELVR